MAYPKIRSCLLMAVGFLLQSSQVEGKYGICTLSCCAVQPSCKAAKQVVCNCDSQRKMELQVDFLPSLVERISIKNMDHVLMKENAIWDLVDLKHFTLRNVTTLEILKNGLARKKNSKLLSLNIEAVKSSCRIHSGAISGHWNSGTNINITNIRHLVLRRRAFNYVSSSNCPSMFVSYVNSLQTDSDWQASNLKQLTMTNMLIPSCRKNGLSGNTQIITLNNVTIDELQAGCIEARKTNIKEISLRFSRILSVKEGAITGGINSLKIDSCEFHSVYSYGFNLHVRTTRISKSQFKRLDSNGLTVKAAQSMVLSDVNIEYLRTHALLGLRMLKNKEGGLTSFHIERLKVDTADIASLKFAECQSVTLTLTDIGHPWPPICPTERWARELVGKSTTEPLNAVEMQVFLKLRDKNKCPGSDGHSYPKTSSDLHCDSEPKEIKINNDTENIPVSRDLTPRPKPNKLSSTRRPGAVKITLGPAASKPNAVKEDTNTEGTVFQRKNSATTMVVSMSTSEVIGGDTPTQGPGRTYQKGKPTTSVQINKNSGVTSNTVMTQAVKDTDNVINDRTTITPTEKLWKSYQITQDPERQTSANTKKEIDTNYVTTISSYNDYPDTASTNTVTSVLLVTTVMCALGTTVIVCLLICLRIKSKRDRNLNRGRTSTTEVSKGTHSDLLSSGCIMVSSKLLCRPLPPVPDDLPSEESLQGSSSSSSMTNNLLYAQNDQSSDTNESENIYECI